MMPWLSEGPARGCWMTSLISLSSWCLVCKLGHCKKRGGHLAGRKETSPLFSGDTIQRPGELHAPVVCWLLAPCSSLPASAGPCRKRRPSAREDGGVSGVSSSCGARGGFLPRHQHMNWLERKHNPTIGTEQKGQKNRCELERTEQVG